MSGTKALLPISTFTMWLANGERGISSEAIVQKLTGVPLSRHQWGSTHPLDPSDFRRCQLLLANYPLAKLALGTMRDVSPEWARLVDAWDEIHETFEAECPNYLAGRLGRRAAKTYMLMRRVIHDGTTCTACDGTGRGEACEKCRGTGSRAGGRCRAKGCYGQGYHACPACRGLGYIETPR